MGCRLSAPPRPGAGGKKKSPTPFGAGLRGRGNEGLRLDVHVLDVLTVDALQRAGVAVEGVVE